MPSERILITGATGFVGRHLIARLLLGRRPLTLAVRKAVACSALWFDQSNVRIIETGPIEACEFLQQALSDVRAVVHLAGLAHIHKLDARGEQLFLSANADATAKLAQAIKRSSARVFVNLSSLAAVTENASATTITDETRNDPLTPYGRSKRLAESHVLSTTANGIFAISLRPPLIVGSDAKGNWHSLQRIAATGLPLPFASVHNKRSMIGIDSLVDLIMHLCAREWPAEKSGNYCIADPEVLSLPTIVTELRKGMGIPRRLVPFPPSLLYTAARLAKQRHRAAGLLGGLEVDSSRFCRTFGFRGTHGLKEAIRKSGALYFRQGTTTR